MPAQRSVVVRLRAEVDQFRQGMNTAATAADQASNRFEGMEKAGKKLALVGGVILAGVGLAVKAYADFDAQMSKVQAATHATSGEMDKLRAAAIEAGADTAFSAEEAGQAIEELSKAGVSTADILNGGLDGALSLAAAGSLAVADAAEIAATALTQFKLSGDKVPHLADLLAAGAGKAQGSVEDLGMALKQAGLVASQYGLSVEETVGGLSAFASAGLIGSDAGTSFKSMLQRLTPQSKEAASKMEELGFTAFDAQGNIKPLSAIADNLQKSMKNLTPEARNAAMGIIFGSDAVRAASVLYEQGAEGINKWIGAVDDAGYAALTASIQQNNLKGDIERLGGSIDSVFLKAGSGANDVLRGLAKGAEDVVDWVGKIPAPMLATAATVTGVLGAVTLLTGGLLTAVPKVMAARAAWIAFSASNTALAGTLVKTAKVAGIALAAIMALQIIASIAKSTEKARAGIEDFNQAMLGMKPKDFDGQVSGMMDGVDGIGDAFVRLGNGQWYDSINSGLGDLTGWGSPIKTLSTAVGNLDTSMTDLSKNGGLVRAGQAFRMVADEADKSAKAQGRAGMSAQDVLNLLPQYTASLKEQAQALGVQASDAELLEMAYGRIPPRIAAMAEANGKAGEVQQIQQQINEETAKALEEIGVSADGVAYALDRFVQALFRAGDAQLGQRDAAREYIASIQAVDDAIAQNGRTLDINTKAGRDNEAAFDAVAAAGMRNIGAMAANGSSQQDLQKKLGDTFNDLIGVAGKFGITGGAADALARKVLGIPPGVNIDTWMADSAKRMAEQTTGAINGIPKQVTVNIDTYKTTFERVVGLPPKADGSYGQGLGVLKKAGGGLIPEYHSIGGAVGAQYLAGGGRATTVAMIPNGTDTVPVMGTPGEFMVKRSSARSLGYEQLAYANATGRWPGAGSSGPQVSVTYGNVTVTDINELMRRQDTASRDALAMLRP
jgi:TP901 family phage tail tape measure protein